MAVVLGGGNLEVGTLRMLSVVRGVELVEAKGQELWGKDRMIGRI